MTVGIIPGAIADDPSKISPSPALEPVNQTVFLNCFDHLDCNYIIPGLISPNSLGHRLKAGDGERRAIPSAWRKIAQRSNSTSAGIN